jgi:hypothetical protein
MPTKIRRETGQFRHCPAIAIVILIPNFAPVGLLSLGAHAVIHIEEESGDAFLAVHTNQVVIVERACLGEALPPNVRPSQ